jgi:hypothetical protein
LPGRRRDFLERRPARRSCAGIGVTLTHGRACSGQVLVVKL